MVLLQRYDPFGEIGRRENAFDRFSKGLGGRYWGYYPYVASRAAPLDVQEDDDSIIVRASLPGAAPEDIRVTTEDGVLSIDTETAEENEREDDSYLVRERRNGSFHRSLRLPDTVDAETPEAGYEHGVLTVTFPKIEAKKARRVEVKVKS